jgi:hypothetical protein
MHHYKCIKAKTVKPNLRVNCPNFGPDSPFVLDVTVHYTSMLDLHELACALLCTPDIMVMLPATDCGIPSIFRN